MSDAAIAKLHSQLASLAGESTRQQAHAKHILASAKKMLEGVEKRLAEIHGMTDGDEYQKLLVEKGTLQQVIEQASRPDKDKTQSEVSGSADA